MGAIICWLVAVPVWTWVALAFALTPGWPESARALAVIAWLGLTAGIWKLRPGRRLAFVLGLSLGLAMAWALLVRPRDGRTWATGHEHVPRVTFSGDSVTIEHLRNAAWRSPTDVDMRWETRTYDLSGMRSVDLVVEPFDDWRGLAHIFVTFGFADGEHVAVSIEARREADEGYSPLRGAFRHYELLYVIGDERDLIGLRANVRRDPVYVFPTRATPDEARALFVSLLQRASGLRERPEFYNTLTSTCATGLVRHVNEVREHDVGLLDWRIAFPGYADALAWDLDLIAWEGTLEEARARFLINGRSALDAARDGTGWSRQIRDVK